MPEWSLVPNPINFDVIFMNKIVETVQLTKKDIFSCPECDTVMAACNRCEEFYTENSMVLCVKDDGRTEGHFHKGFEDKSENGE